MNTIKTATVCLSKFDGLVKFSNPIIQLLLREAPCDTLLTAIKDADTAVQDKIFNNMSARGAEMMRADIANMPTLEQTLVEVAQRQIIEICKDLVRRRRLKPDSLK